MDTDSHKLINSILNRISTSEPKNDRERSIKAILDEDVTQASAEVQADNFMRLMQAMNDIYGPFY